MIQLLVVTGDQVIPTGKFEGSGTALNLKSGQLGIMSFDPNSSVRPLGEYLQTGDDSSEVQAIKLVQGTPASQNLQLADIWEVGDKSHIESGIIRRNRIRSVYVKKPKFATLGAQVITGFPTVVNNGHYFSYLSLTSTRYEKEYGITNKNSLYASSPVVADYTGITNTLDYVLTNLLSSFNSQSKAVSTTLRRGNQSFVVS